MILDGQNQWIFRRDEGVRQNRVLQNVAGVDAAGERASVVDDWLVICSVPQIQFQRAAASFQSRVIRLQAALSRQLITFPFSIPFHLQVINQHHALISLIIHSSSLTVQVSVVRRTDVIMRQWMAHVLIDDAVLFFHDIETL